jgi:chromosome segregation ATPase
MKTSATIILIILTVLGLHAGHDPISSLERELAQASRELDAARCELNRLSSEERHVRSCLDAANVDLSAAVRENDAIESSLRHIHKRLTCLRADANALQARKTSLERRLACAPPPCPNTRYSHRWQHHDPNAGLRAELAAVTRDLQCVRDEICKLEREDRTLHSRKPAVLARIEQGKRVTADHRRKLDRVVCDLRNAKRDVDQLQARVNHINHELQVARCHRPAPQPEPVVVVHERHEHHGHRDRNHRQRDWDRDAHIARDIGAIIGLFAHLASH